MNTRISQLAFLAALAAGVCLPASGATLKVGDSAPKLQVSKWVQGGPVKEFAGDKAYIVEFWATWCGPCRVSIPHLNELHTKFKDKGLVVIGQNVWERDLAAVEPFVKNMGDKMTYRVAMDDKSTVEKGAMATTWMEAAGQNGIPAAFVVDKKGLIAWIGHPMSLGEETLQQVLDGTFDVKKAAAEQAEREKNRAELQQFSRKLGKAMQEEDWAGADAALDEIEKRLSKEERVGVGSARLRVRLGSKDWPGAYKLAGELSDQNPKNAMLQNDLAWTLITTKGLDQPDLKLAEKLAVRANEAANGKDPAILDTLARVQFMKGEKQKAIATQEAAVTLAEGQAKDRLQETLDSYKKGELPKAD